MALLATNIGVANPDTAVLEYARQVGVPGLNTVPTCGSVLMLEFGKDIALVDGFYAPGSIGSFSLQVPMKVHNQTQITYQANEWELIALTKMSGMLISERGTTQIYQSLLVKQDVLDTSTQEPYTRNEVHRLVGGGFFDSWNILHSFLSNGIHIDEIYTRWAFDELKYKDYDPTNLDEYNIISEYKYTVIPVLEHIKKTYPKTKIVVDDYSPLMQGEFQESDLAASIQYHHIGAYVRWAIPSEGQLSAKRQGKSVGLVYGQDKIRFQIKDNKFYAHFIECLGGTDSLDYNQELFYWTVDFPTIPILQAHYIKDHFIEFPNERGFFTGGRDMTKMYQKICYPQYNSDTFQVGKPMGVMHRKSDAWIYAYNRKYYDSWQWSMKQFYDTIDESYLSFRNGNFVVGTKKMSSPLYYVGTLPDSFQVDIDINGQTPF